MDVTYLQNNADTLIEHMRMRSSCSQSKCHRSIQISFLLGHSSVETTMVCLDITTEQEMTALATLEGEKSRKCRQNGILKKIHFLNCVASGNQSHKTISSSFLTGNI